jgi:hypothetical protein
MRFTLMGASYTIAAHGSVEIDGKFYGALHRKRCDVAECRATGMPWCHHPGHRGRIIGGILPAAIIE